MITQLLPSSITVEVEAEQNTEASPHPRATHKLVDIRLLKPSAEDGGQGVRVEYAHVRSYIADLYASHVGQIGEGRAEGPQEGERNRKSDRPPAGKVELFLHIGMADGWDFVSVERRAYKQGFSCDWSGLLERIAGYYHIPDNAGQTILNTGPCPWLTTPMGLSTSFDVGCLVEGANASLEAESTSRHQSSKRPSEIPITPHDEPGSYCCGFMYYESLANCWVRERRPDVLFCHVPDYLDAASLERGRDCVVAIIEQAVKQLVRRRHAPDERSSH